MKILKGGLVVFGALVITALGIDAADTLTGSRSTLLGQLVATESSVCPVGMIEVSSGFSFSCVDKYEVSSSESCLYQTFSSQFDTEENLKNPECLPSSQPEKPVWNYVSRDQAQLLCLRAGKRLPTNQEWHILALGTAENSQFCNINTGSLELSGASEECVSSVGVNNAVGNVWEWTSDEVVAGVYEGRVVPQSGFVSVADKGGVAVETASEASEAYGKDYFWSDKDASVSAIMRGGFYSSGEDSGVYAAHSGVSSDMKGVAIGFRCVK